MATPPVSVPSADLQKIIDLLNNANLPDASNFKGFNSDQTKVLQKAIADARALCADAITMVGLAPFMKDDDKTVISLRHNFDIDVKDDTPGAAFNGVNLLILKKRLLRLKDGLDANNIPFVYEPTPGFPEAWVVGIEDPTVHIKPDFFDDSFKTDLTRAATILHERAHTILKSPGHPGIGGGLATLVTEAHIDKRPLFTNRARFFEDAIANPYNYEWLCTAIDKRYTPTNSNSIRMSACTCGSGMSYA